MDTTATTNCRQEARAHSEPVSEGPDHNRVPTSARHTAPGGLAGSSCLPHPTPAPSDSPKGDSHPAPSDSPEGDTRPPSTPGQCPPGFTGRGPCPLPPSRVAQARTAHPAGASRRPQAAWDVPAPCPCTEVQPGPRGPAPSALLSPTGCNKSSLAPGGRCRPKPVWVRRKVAGPKQHRGKVGPAWGSRGQLPRSQAEPCCLHPSQIGEGAGGRPGVGGTPTTWGPHISGAASAETQGSYQGLLPALCPYLGIPCEAWLTSACRPHTSTLGRNPLRGSALGASMATQDAENPPDSQRPQPAAPDVVWP